MKAKTAQDWINTIATYDREFKTWENRAKKILKRYRDEARQSNVYAESRFNILWSNVQTIVPAVFARLPKPDVSRRFSDTDPVGRVAALILERALEFEVEHYPDYRAAMTNCVQDRFLGGRGIAWVRYEPHIKTVQGTPEDGFQITEDADESDVEEQNGQQEELEYECAPVDYVHWKDFGHTVARTWEEVTAVWRKVYLGRDALVERFGEEIGGKIPLDTRPDTDKKSLFNDDNYQALIYEIWDKSTDKAYWLSKSLGKIIDERDDPLELENFFPCPRPLYSTLTTDSLVPVPDFTLYQDQANALDVLADRIDGLIKALQVKGIYDASFPELQRLLTEGQNNSLVPVKNWQALSEKNGLKGAIDLLDIQPIAQALLVAYEAVEKVKNQIYEIMGIADILRGASDPNETLGAQQLKGQFGSLRLKDMQSDVAQFATEILRIKAEIMCGQFQPETLASIGGVQQLSQIDQQYVPMALQLLKQEPLRNFRVEVSADSLIQMDENQEKQDRMEFLKASGGFIKEAVQAGIATPQLAPLLMEMLKFGVTGFRVGKTIEGQFDAMADQMKQQAAQPQQPKPDPEMLKIQATTQAEAQKLQLQDQFNERQAQREMQLEQWKQQQQAAQNQHQNALEAQRAQMQAHYEAQLEAQRQALDERMAQMQNQVDVLIARLNNEAKVEVAEIAAGATLQAAQISAAETAIGE